MVKALVITLGTRYSRIHNKFIKVDSEYKPDRVICIIIFLKNSLLSQTFNKYDNGRLFLIYRI